MPEGVLVVGGNLTGQGAATGVMARALLMFPSPIRKDPVEPVSTDQRAGRVPHPRPLPSARARLPHFVRCHDLWQTMPDSKHLLFFAARENIREIQMFAQILAVIHVCSSAM